MLEDRTRKLLRGLNDVDEVMSHAILLFNRWLRGADTHVPVYLH